MPGKHVHFAGAVGPSAPTTPSPSYSVSSLPSSAGPYTPLSGQVIPLAGVYTIHPVLQYSMEPPIHYDVSLPPRAISLRDIHLSNLVLDEPATNPPLPELQLVMSQDFPWTIPIRPGMQPRVEGAPIPSYVTVADVLHGIYNNLRLPVTLHEYHLIPTQAFRNSVDAAYNYRCKRIVDPQMAAVEKHKGVKRIDFLADQHTFHGLSATKYGGHIWKLNTSSL